jgi:Mlc titration factor MtfA (ptsG expression regulator)
MVLIADIREAEETYKDSILEDNQRELLSAKIGLWSRIPSEIRASWEKKILCFLDLFPFVETSDDFPSEDIKLLVAAEAALLVTKRSFEDYRFLCSIYVWENQIPRQPQAHGMASMREVHLSWKYLEKTIGHGDDGKNLVLHEFAHVIDFSDDGKAQSIPVPKTSKDFKFWENLIAEMHTRIVNAHSAGIEFPVRSYAGLQCDKGLTPEIFSCGTSAFFELGESLQKECPDFYDALSKFYKMNPAAWPKSNLR